MNTARNLDTSQAYCEPTLARCLRLVKPESHVRVSQNILEKTQRHSLRLVPNMLQEDLATPSENSIGNACFVYSAFGILLGIRDAQANDVTTNAPMKSSYGFTGREFDSESGLMYYRARYYDPNSGRFLQKDTNPGTADIPVTIVNGYGYVAGNPISLTDPFGHNFLGGLGLILGGVALDIAAVALVASGAGAGFGIALGGLGAGFISSGITDLQGGTTDQIFKSFALGTAVGLATGGAAAGLGTLFGDAFASTGAGAFGAFLGGFGVAFGASKALGATNRNSLLNGLIGGFSGAAGYLGATSLNPGVITPVAAPPPTVVPTGPTAPMGPLYVPKAILP